MIETERLLLRPLAMTHAPAIAHKVNDYEICKNLARVPFPYGTADAVEFITFVLGLDGKSFCAAVFAKDNPSELLGAISYEYSAEKNNAELGYWLVPSCWGQGYGSEAACAVVGHAFAVAGHEELVASFHNDNPASGKILRRLGFEVVTTGLHFSKAQNRMVPATSLVLSREHWLLKQKSREM
jgi:RimJ/RimL family protein N-acetyltransferase